MKYIVLLCDGMADYPVDELNGATPMEVAKKPNMDRLAENAEIGLVKTVADSVPPGSDVANLSVMGYDPTKCYTGRSPIEAYGMGIDMSETDVAIRCNLVTLSNDEPYENKTMLDYCAGDISTEEAREIIKTVKQHFDGVDFEFHPGVSYRHCLIWHNGSADIGELTPPHDISQKVIGPHLNTNPKAAPLIELMKKSVDILKDHPVNIERIKRGENPVTSLWFWGQGTKPCISNFREKTGLNGAVVTAVDLLRGIATCAGMSIGKVEGATGYIDTNFAGKAQSALEELEKGADFVYIHIEAPDECGHRGEVQNKIKAIEMIDELTLAPILKGLEKYDDYAILILPDHPTPIATRTHARDPIPYLMYRKGATLQNNLRFTEADAKKSGILIDPGCTLFDRFKNYR